MLYFPGHVKELESWLQDISKANEEKEEADSNRLISSSILPIEEVSIELVDNTSIHDGKNYGGGGSGGSSNDDKVKTSWQLGGRQGGRGNGERPTL